MLGIPDWAIGVAFIMLAVAVARAIAGRSALGQPARGRKASWRDLAQSLEDVQRRLAELEDGRSKLGNVEDLQSRLSEVEERLDFAERVLAKQRDADRIAPPKS
jgi:predicted nuclease with TOPRIM domain